MIAENLSKWKRQKVPEFKGIAVDGLLGEGWRQYFPSASEERAQKKRKSE